MKARISGVARPQTVAATNGSNSRSLHPVLQRPSCQGESRPATQLVEPDAEPAAHESGADQLNARFGRIGQLGLIARIWVFGHHAVGLSPPGWREGAPSCGAVPGATGWANRWSSAWHRALIRTELGERYGSRSSSRGLRYTDADLETAGLPPSLRPTLRQFEREALETLPRCHRAGQAHRGARCDALGAREAAPPELGEA